VDVTIREARDSDAEAIALLLGELGYETDAAAVPPRLERMRAEAGQWTLVAEVGGGGGSGEPPQVVGMATIIVRHVINNDAPFGRLASVAVADGWRSRGIGAALIARAEEICRDAGCNLIEVTSGAHRERAHEFYRRLGFEERPRRFIKHL
jgi:GNAT superfamily N-acetyltransferase